MAWPGHSCSTAFRAKLGESASTGSVLCAIDIESTFAWSLRTRPQKRDPRIPQSHYCQALNSETLNPIPRILHQKPEPNLLWPKMIVSLHSDERKIQMRAMDGTRCLKSPKGTNEPPETRLRERVDEAKRELLEDVQTAEDWRLWLTIGQRGMKQWKRKGQLLYIVSYMGTTVSIQSLVPS